MAHIMVPQEIDPKELKERIHSLETQENQLAYIATTDFDSKNKTIIVELVIRISVLQAKLKSYGIFSDILELFSFYEERVKQKIKQHDPCILSIKHSRQQKQGESCLEVSYVIKLSDLIKIDKL